MSETPMTEARIEEIVAQIEGFNAQEGGELIDIPYVRRMESLLSGACDIITGWRAKKAEIERLREGLTQAELDLDAAVANHDACCEIVQVRAAEAMRAKCEAIARPWLSTGTLKLRAGEMTAQEVRSVKAVVGSIVRSIAALKQS